MFNFNVLLLDLHQLVKEGCQRFIPEREAEAHADYFIVRLAQQEADGRTIYRKPKYPCSGRGMQDRSNVPAMVDVMMDALHRMKTLGAHWSQWIPNDLISLTPQIQGSRHIPPYAIKVTPQSSTLLSLPPELRQIVYDYCFTHNQTGSFYGNDKLPGLLAPKYATQPAISRVCRQSRRENLPMFYSSNVFVLKIETLASLEAAHDWLRRIGDYHVGQMQNLILIGFVDSVTTGPTLQLGINLQTCSINGLTGVRHNTVHYLRFMDMAVRKVKERAAEHTITAELLRPLLNCFARLCSDTWSDGSPLLSSSHGRLTSDR
ncbi:hypothetical protein LTR37_004637 [Vermiconidia calcicola]|uniref:Uncharacterized protein n=1 Tax=Vermiconidia calcicola TaxID=1690605 RepID=A0ACC3NLU7_9PEZI|nr:hypothetical protein LTR37_004637 [Vermiconidia calcicola]